MHVIEAGDFEIERRLESYARARLSPDPLAIARVRARVMREARLQADLPRITVLGSPATPRIRRSATRRLSMAVLAAAVWIGVAAGSMFAAQAGGPLYPARMWVEQATLPGEPAARAAAELTRLDARLADALAAAARGDSGAVQAALDAYGEIADEMIAATVGNASLESAVAAALDKHVAVLGEVAARLGEKGNSVAAGAVGASIARAIDHNQDVIDQIESRPATGAGAAPGGTGTTGGAGSGAGSGAGGPQPTGATGEATDKPSKAPKPTADSTPDKPSPVATVKPTPKATTPTPPEHTPRSNSDN